ncbi:MAG: membrane protein insertion efficiency factor YidD [Candidatus Omnitrophota bacterium]
MKTLLIFVVGVYQRCLRWFFVPSCRFVPCCSDYCILALQKHGLAKGTILTLKRLGRCHPWSPGGYDAP